jgi:hypothetical protein
MSATDRNELDGYEGLVSELRATAPVAPEQLRQRVLELAPVPRRRWISSRRRLALVVVPVAVALAVGAALVHGFVSSGSNPQNRADAGAPGLATTGNAHSSAGPVKQQLHAASRQPKATESAPTLAAPNHAFGQALTSGRDSLTIPRNRVVHAAATLEVRVPNRSALSQKTNKATQIVASLGGYAQSVQYQSSHQGYGSAYLDLRVPVGKAQTAIAQLGALGTLVSQEISTRDLQQQLTRQNNQIGLLRRSIAVYEQALQSGTLSASQRVEIQIRLSNAQHSLKLLRKARTSTLASGATADISLTLTTSKSAIVVPHHHKSGRFGRLLGSAAGFLGLEGIIVLYALVVLSPVLVLGGLGWWLLRERRRREENRLLASA